MKPPAIVRPGRQRTLALGLLLAGLLGLAACQPAAEIAATDDTSEDAVAIASDPIDDEPIEDVVEPEAAEEAPITRIEFVGEWRSDLPPNIALVVPGGRFSNNGFPALSTDLEQIAILYFAGHPMQGGYGGYPTFELHSTTTLELLERIDLFSKQEKEQIIQATGQAPDPRDPQLLRRIESMLDEINCRLEQGRFRPMETLFRLPLPLYDPLAGVEKFGKRIDYPGDENTDSLVIRSISTGRIEFEMEMPTGVETYENFPDMGCGWGGLPEQAWYDPGLGIMVLRLIFSTSRDGCEQPELWYVKRLGML